MGDVGKNSISCIQSHFGIWRSGRPRISVPTPIGTQTPKVTLKEITVRLPSSTSQLAKSYPMLLFHLITRPFSQVCVSAPFYRWEY